MSSGGSVTHWLTLLKAGADAVQPLWERYFARLVGLARARLRGAPRRAADEEDVALSAFDSFCRNAAAGRFPRLLDRDDLWQLLVLLTARKAINLREHESRQKRGGGRLQGESALRRPGEEAEEAEGLDAVVGTEPTPEFAAEVAEEWRLLLDRLGDAELRAVALWKMEGYSNQEIAERLGCVERSVERKLRIIRGVWEAETAP
jgi:DNA-directed RNA polymerase specialized sigma24 family protein